jgi:hypothetical protein
MRIASVPKWTFADVVVANLFGTWGRGETLILLVGKEGVVTATVSGKAFVSDQMIWEGDLYEHRVPVHIEKVLRGAAGVAANQAVHKALASGLGNIYGTYIMSQNKLPEEVEKLVRAAL